MPNHRHLRILRRSPWWPVLVALFNILDIQPFQKLSSVLAFRSALHSVWSCVQVYYFYSLLTSLLHLPTPEMDKHQEKGGWVFGVFGFGNASLRVFSIDNTSLAIFGFEISSLMDLSQYRSLGYVFEGIFEWNGIFPTPRVFD
jgi:hypothetical protein